MAPIKKLVVVVVADYDYEVTLYMNYLGGGVVVVVVGSDGGAKMKTETMAATAVGVDILLSVNETIDGSL